MDIGADRALIGGAAGLLRRRRHATLAQHNEGLFHIALGFLQGLETVAHRGARLFTEFLDELGVNLYSFSGGHNLPSSIGAAHKAHAVLRKWRGPEPAP